jgi:amino acid adenylation domain-containing protein
VAAQVVRSPDAVAVVSGAETISYAQLDRRANQFAHHLIGLGAGRGSLVAVCADRSIELMVALLGILKTGAAYVPVDARWPASRLDFIMADTQARGLVTQRYMANRLAGRYAAPVVPLDAPGDVPDTPDTDPDVAVAPDDLAYVMYTSGSTGEPKGAMLEHAGVCNQLVWMWHHYGFGAHDRVLLKAPYTFDLSLWELFLPLISGGSVVIAKLDGHRDPEYLAEITRRERITTLHFVPSMLRLFMERSRVEACASVRHVFCIGEVLPRELQDRFYADFSIPLYNLYGPTEASVAVTHWRCSPDDPRPFVPIGVPLDNVECLILDEELRAVPVGEPGELVIGGVAVARGYLNRPELTERAFVRNPGAGLPNARWYRTGDQVRLLHDGNLEYLGRKDHQVKIRGHRIELADIEAQLRRLPEIAEAVVVVDDEAMTPRLVAYLEATTEPDAGDLRAQLAAVLPDYMIPAGFRLVDRLGLSANGKLDRAAVRRQAFRSLTSTSDAPPRNDRERVLVQVWSQILGCPVGIDDDFVRLGGDSMLAVRASALAKEHGVPVTVEDLLTRRTIARLAAVGEACPAAGERAVAAGEADTTAAQRTFLTGGPADNGHHSVSVSMKGEGIDPVVLQAALGDLAGHHGALRSRFRHHDGRWRQRITALGGDPATHLSLTQCDLRGLPGAVCDRELHARAAGAQQSLDPVNGPVARAMLISSDQGDTVLLVLHYLVADSWSLQVLAEDLSVAYAQRRRNEPARLPPEIGSVLAWGDRWEAEALAADSVDRYYWLTDRPSTPSGTMWTAAGGRPGDVHRITRLLNGPSTEEFLGTVPRELAADVDELLVTALYTALVADADRTGDLLLDLERPVRPAPVDGMDYRRTVGRLADAFPVTLPPVGRRPAGAPDLVPAVRAALRRIPRHGMGFAELREQERDLALRDELAALPAPAIRLTCVGGHRTTPGQLRRVPSPGPNGHAGSRCRHEVHLTTLVVDAGLHLLWEFDANRCPPHAVHRLADRFESAITDLVAAARHRAHATAGLPLSVGAADLSLQDLRTLRALTSGQVGPA